MRRHAARTVNAWVGMAAGLWLAFAACAPAVAGESGYRIEGARRVVAIADVHGAYDELVSLLRTLGIVDASLRWSGADTQLVSLGDLVDRGPASRPALDLFMRLEGEARAAGGAVHVLLGNSLERELGAWLHRRQIDALLKRRDLLLREHGRAAAD